ncbi:MAG: shikimate kinase [Bacteroidales bacterium]
MQEKYSHTRIYLLGFMGSGKSTLGKRLSRSMGYNFVDTDQVFEDRYNIEIPHYFKLYGEAQFREIEQTILQETFTLKNTIISTGGGTPCYSDNLSEMKKHGLCIYLKLPAATLHQRLLHTTRLRPLIENLDDTKLLDYIHKNLIVRETYYNKANLVVSGVNLRAKDLEAILSHYKSL